MKEYLLNKNEEYLIGVSGGCDSMYLLDLLRRQQYKIRVAHVNYHYREDSDLDTQLVEAYCKQNEIPLHIKHCQKEDYEVGNFQATAREIRYVFYKEIADEYGIKKLLLAHHKDDYLENVYMQLEKHQVKYYLGILEVVENYGLTIHRPLLDTYKIEIIKQCEIFHIPYRDDYTNFETDFKRDEIRNNILKYFSNPQKEALYQKAITHNCRIETALNHIQKDLALYKRQGYIDYKQIDQKYLSLFIYQLLYNEVKVDLTSQLVEEVIKQIRSHKPNIIMNLPVNNLFIKEYDNIRVEQNSLIGDYCFIVEKGQMLHDIYFSTSTTGPINQGVDVKDEEYPLTIRNSQKGDIIKTKGGTKKVNRLFINNKVPLSKRKTYPIVLNAQNEIILIPNIAKNINHLSTKANFFVII